MAIFTDFDRVAPMCFTPAVSLATAVTEFSISGYILKRGHKQVKGPLSAFVFALGAYQFTEFMLCMVQNPAPWARAGFIAYSALPILLLHSFINLSGKRFRKELYAVPIVFISYILLQDDFLVRSACNLFTASVHHVMFQSDKALMWLYFAYYASFPAYGLCAYMYALRRKMIGALPVPLKMVMGAIPLALLFAHAYFVLAAVEHMDAELVWLRISVIVWMTIMIVALLAAIPLATKSAVFDAILIITLASSITTTFILYAYFPQFSYDFPSIYCHFAILYGFAAAIVARNGEAIAKSE